MVDRKEGNEKESRETAMSKGKHFGTVGPKSELLPGSQSDQSQEWNRPAVSGYLLPKFSSVLL
eukprot:6783817-Ditylum_brightwellii.AAC.1